MRDTDGYPATLAINERVSTLMARDVEKHVPDGWYTVYYDGQGTLDFAADVKIVRRVRPGKILIYVVLTAKMQTDNGIGLSITHTLPSDPIRNIRVIMPGFAAINTTHNPFHPAFLTSLQGFESIRFMNWQGINAETPQHWNRTAARRSRATPGNGQNDASYFPPSPYYSQSLEEAGGADLNYILLLTNTLGVDPWLNLPMHATDDYIAQFGKTLARKLRPDTARVYIEMGNEVWASNYFGGQHANKVASAEGIPKICWFARRTAQAAIILRREMFGTASTSDLTEAWVRDGANAKLSSHTTKLHVVLASQAANADVTRQMLACKEMTSEYWEQIDAIGLAPYFDGYSVLPGARTNSVQGVSMDQVCMSVCFLHQLPCLNLGLYSDHVSLFVQNSVLSDSP